MKKWTVVYQTQEHVKMLQLVRQMNNLLEIQKELLHTHAQRNSAMHILRTMVNELEKSLSGGERVSAEVEVDELGLPDVRELPF